MTFNSSEERLNSIGAHLGGISRYLEIGVARGNTFFKVQAKDKHAVDPRLCFDSSTRSSHKDETYHCCTSDQFFSKILKMQIKPFDLIFLDGLHTYSQTLRDFLACQAISHSRTIWMIDDTVPSDPIAADSSLSRVKAARSLTDHPNDETWMGDVFKVVAFIDSFCPQFRCFTTVGHGQTVVLPLPRVDKEIRFSNIDDISKLSFVDVILLRENLLAPVAFEEILDHIDKLS